MAQAPCSMAFTSASYLVYYLKKETMKLPRLIKNKPFLKLKRVQEYKRVNIIGTAKFEVVLKRPFQ